LLAPAALTPLHPPLASPSSASLPPQCCSRCASCARSTPAASCRCWIRWLTWASRATRHAVLRSCCGHAVLLLSLHQSGCRSPESLRCPSRLDALPSGWVANRCPPPPPPRPQHTPLVTTACLLTRLAATPPSIAGGGGGGGGGGGAASAGRQPPLAGAARACSAALRMLRYKDGTAMCPLLRAGGAVFIYTVRVNLTQRAHTHAWELAAPPPSLPLLAAPQAEQGGGDPSQIEALRRKSELAQEGAAIRKRMRESQLVRWAGQAQAQLCVCAQVQPRRRGRPLVPARAFRCDPAAPSTALFLPVHPPPTCVLLLAGQSTDVPTCSRPLPRPPPNPPTPTRSNPPPPPPTFPAATSRRAGTAPPCCASWALWTGRGW
jgi:hypothetical protein